jgi:hypothetical protein
MRIWLPGLGGLAMGVLAGGMALAAGGGLEQRTEASRAVVKAFAAELTGRLQKALAAGGPVEAIEVCHTAAPAIAAAQSGRSGWEVGRTSLRLRNPSNAPDAWERAVLEGFEARKAAGEDVARMEHAEIVKEDGGRAFRYMKAIPTAALCTACHGSDLEPAVAAALAELYPADRATGFAVGDIRGAFTIRQPM